MERFGKWIGGAIMKRKPVFILGVVGVLVLSIGIMEEVSANEQPISESAFIGQADIEDRDQYRFITVEEQNMRESNSIENGDRYTFITVEEQNTVENSSALSGFVQQENGPGFFFQKVK